MGRRSLLDRLDQVTAVRARGDLHHLADRLAAEVGITPGELLGEAQVLADRCQAQGITTVAGMVAMQAQELGIPVAELQAGADALGELIP